MFTCAEPNLVCTQCCRNSWCPLDVYRNDLNLLRTMSRISIDNTCDGYKGSLPWNHMHLSYSKLVIHQSADSFAQGAGSDDGESWGELTDWWGCRFAIHMPI